MRSEEMKTLSLKFTYNEVEYGAYSTYEYGDYFLVLGNCTALRERCRAVAEANGGDADHVESMLRSLMEWLFDNDYMDVGSVLEEGWYTPAYYCHSDPAAACDSDGGIAEATVLAGSRHDLYPLFQGTVHTAIEGMVSDVDNEWLTAEAASTLRICENQIAEWMTAVVLSFNGRDIHEE